MSNSFSFLRRHPRNPARSSSGNKNGSSSTSTSTPPAPSDLGSDSSEDANGAMPGNNNGNEPDTILNGQYARARRVLLELVRDLRALGHDKDLDIPQIAVIGKQSAGKSSLVEAVAGINVPRDAGTCTRCPMECTILTSSAQWSCSISLRGDGINTAFSPVLTSKDVVELWIRRAQAAVLCPHLDRDIFKTMSREQIRQVTDCGIDEQVKKFSNTVVEVKICDPNGADLVFVDLPGLISNEDEDVVNQVENMVKQYVSLPSTIILVTVPAEDDLENQKAMKLAKEADPHGERTIGVVTKVDKIGAGETGRQKSWKDIFEGRARDHRLRLGYYAVRLPTDEDRARNVSPAQMREQAARVFDTVAPWKDLKALPGPTRLGVEALIRDISPLLMRMLIEAIPRLKTAVDQLLAACLADLARLPARHEMDSAAELVQLVFKFCEAVKQTVDGASDDKSFVHRSVEHYRALKVAVRATAPDFRPFEAPAEYFRPPEPRSQQREDDFSTSVLGGVAACSRSASVSGSVIEEPDQEAAVMGVLDVRRVIKESTGWELPHNVPYLAKTRLIREFVRRWTDPSKTCFAGIRNLVEEHVYDALVPQHFDQFPLLKQFVVTQLRENIEEHLESSEVAVRQVLKREELPYFTQNGHYLETTREIWLGHYKEVRALRESTYRIGVVRGAFTRSTHPSVETSRAELIVMADVRSYFQVSYKRVIDNVPQTIHHDFVQGFADGLQAYLLGKLDLGGKDASQRLEKLLEEDPSVSRRRRYLQDRKKRLEEMKIRLTDFRI
ncbi:P-loop containing nucleoside triphosphate hydrolase protein [Ganoderma leucocontextum]|nr:P-loop containing nucleoside triphosphate hydrolase protein [Ganoderma leucocontextum]